MSIPVQTHVINGESAAPVSDQYIDLINPSTGEMAGHGADGDAADVDIAVAAAKQAYTAWKETSTSARAAIISRMGLVLGANLEELVALEASCTGLSAARLMSFDIPGVMQFFQTFAENLEDYAFVEYPPVRTLPEAYDVKVVKQPLGVCGLIPAWNGPLFLSFVKALPAIAAGNTVVIKPAETASLAVVRAVELLQDVVPPGVINVVTGYGHTAGAALASHPDVAKISFTGSGRTGSLIQKMAADTTKRVTLELGGKGPGIALPDAPVELTARGATVAFLLGSGQICVSGTRLFLHDSIHDEVVARMVELAGALRGGSPFDPQTTLAPMAYKAHYERVLGYMEQGQSDGATLACGGTKQSGYGREINIASMDCYLETQNHLTSFEIDPTAKPIFGLVHRDV
ncbi:MAG: aldehyde dehydrogenase family protein [Gammaproteobacteria bacterium]|nr:aldehyde dehydrogenase family protein [Gammaproteobacteria bacterium]